MEVMTLQQGSFYVCLLLACLGSLTIQQDWQTRTAYCIFEDADICNYTNDITADTPWEWTGAQEPSIHCNFNYTDGHFIYSQLGPSFGEYDVYARIISPLYNYSNGFPQCLQFSYYMDGDQVGELKVYTAYDWEVKQLTGDMVQWSQTYNDGPGWREALVRLQEGNNFHVVFEAIRGRGDHCIGIDDFYLYNEECPSTDECDFERGLCMWSEVGDEVNSGQWWEKIRVADRYPEALPDTDHTTGFANGSYLRVIAEERDKTFSSWLYSQVFPGTPGHPFCFTFWYAMIGNSQGRLRVFIRNSISSRSVYSDADLWEMHSPTANYWHMAQVNISKIYTQKPFMIILDAAVENTTDVDPYAIWAFAVDDTRFQAMDCATEPPRATVTPDSDQSPNCNFDDGTMCAWKRADIGNSEFTVGKQVTWWSGDHNSSTGKFLLVDSEQLPPNSVATALSPLLPDTTNGVNCLSLWYRLLKDTNSSLEIDMVTVGTNLPLWKAFPVNNDQWMPAAINIHSNFDYKLLIRAKVGEDFIGSIGVDDIKLSSGACPRPEVVDFENGFMGFTPFDDDDIGWNLTEASLSFVQSDHSYGTPAGHVLEVDMDAPEGKTLLGMKTPLLLPTGDECLEFWYYKTGSNASKLSVLYRMNEMEFHVYEEWSTTENTSGWMKAYVPFYITVTHWIYFQATSDTSSIHEQMAIDDIRFLPTKCPSEIDCDFEYDDCGYTSTQDGPVTWQFVKGFYETSIMPVDHTTKTNQGSYMEVDIPETTGRTYTVTLTSRELEIEGNQCVSFWYYGRGNGTLQVSLKTGPQNVTIISTIDITPDDVARLYQGWHDININTTMTPGFPDFSSNSTMTSKFYQLQFTFTGQLRYTSFAIDDIMATPDSCANIDKRTTFQSNGENKLDQCATLQQCNFDAGSLCAFTNSNTSTVNWTIFSTDTEREVGTGIDYDNTNNNRYGHYIFLDTSGKKANDTAQLITQPISANVFTCLSFSYVMNGIDVNKLNVYLLQGQTRKLFWTMSGDQGKDWQHIMLDIPKQKLPVPVMIEAVAGGGDLGDIGLDDVGVYYGQCPTQAECTFEEGDMTNKYDLCSMDQDNLDEADWELCYGALRGNSDPHVDHTYQTDQGHYMRMDMETTQSGDRARIFTKTYNAESAICLEFWYHITNPMDGNHVLLAILRDETGLEKTIGTYKGFFDDVWNQVQVPITLIELDNFQIGFQGQSGGQQGTIAIDDILVSEDECDNFISCGFESSLSMCGWEPVTDFTNPPWRVLPSHHYMTANFSAANQVTKIASETIPVYAVNDFCLSVAYMMYGQNVGYFNISFEVEFPDPQTIVAYSIGGSKISDAWSTVIVNKPQINMGTFRFVITGSSAENFDSTQVGTIQVANILFSYDSQKCVDNQDAQGTTFTCSNSGETISSDEVCNFMKDCPQGDDEQNCGTCDFERKDCNWQIRSGGPVSFVDFDIYPDQMDVGNHTGDYFMSVLIHDGEDHDYGELVFPQDLGPTPYGCMMTFDYFLPVMDRLDSGNLYLVMTENFEETELWHSVPSTSFTWQQAYVDIGGIHSRFTLQFRASELPFDNAMGIDDVAFIGCSFPESVDGPCPEDKFKCTDTGACIDSSKLCDFADECGDGSDEYPPLCVDYIMDNFEDSFGYWSQDRQGPYAFVWTRHSGRWLSETNGPRRDHTLGTHFGHYALLDPRGQWDGATSGLLSPEFPATTDGQCKIRFYYHMYGASDGLLTLSIKSKVRDNTTVIRQYRTTLNDSWIFDEQVLTCPDAFQVELLGTVEGYYSTEVGLDDISFTPACQGTTSTTTKSTTPQSTSKSRQQASTTSTTSQISTGQTSATTTANQSPSSAKQMTPHSTSTSRQQASTTSRTSQISTRQTSATTTANQSPSSAKQITPQSTSTSRQQASTTSRTSQISTGQTAGMTTANRSPSSAKQMTTKGPITVPSKHSTAGTSTETTSVIPKHQPATGSGGSDSWKIAVGVVLGLVGVIAIIAGTLIYLKRTNRLTRFRIPFFRGNYSEMADTSFIVGRSNNIELDDAS